MRAFLFIDDHLLLVSSHGGRDQGVLWGLFIWAQIPFIWTLPSESPLKTPLLQIPSHWGLGVDIWMRWGGDTDVHSVAQNSPCASLLFLLLWGLPPSRMTYRGWFERKPVFFRTTMISWMSTISGVFTSLLSKHVLQWSLPGSEATVWFPPGQGQVGGGDTFKLPQNPKATGPTATKKVKSIYYKWLYAHKFNKLNEVDQLY